MCVCARESRFSIFNKHLWYSFMFKTCYIDTFDLNACHKLTDYHVNSQECVAKLNMRQLVSVSMDGPNVNLKLGDLLQKEHAELYGAQLVKVGSCGLHTLHNAVKAGFTSWTSSFGLSTSSSTMFQLEGRTSLP